MKEAYVTSPFTLAFMDNFAVRKVQTRSQKSNLTLHCRKQASLVPDFAVRNKKAFDKQNLLQQVRKQKIKHQQLTASNGFMKRQLSQTKIAALSKINNLQTQFNTISPSLKRQIQQLIQQIEQNNKQISKIKTLKKYNRFMELQSAKQVYLQEIKQLQSKISTNKYSLKEQRRIVKEQGKREKGMKAMNKAIEIDIMNQNNTLINKIQELDSKIRDDSLKQINLQRQKKRLYQEVLELQKMTGKFYVAQKQTKQQVCFYPQQQEEHYQNLKEPQMLFEKQPILKDISYDEAWQQEEDEQEEQQEQYSFEDEEEQDNESTQAYLKQQNQSF